jgi:transmembrane protein 231
VKKVTALFAFDYELAGTVTMAMNSMAYVQGSSPTSGSGMFVDGYLKLEQMDAIRADTSRYDYNYSVFPFAEHGELVTQTREATELQIATVMNAYIARNETTHYDYKYPVWMSAESPDFTFQARIRIPASQQVLYRPGFLELCKYAWVQILSTYLIFWWLFTKFEWVVFHFRIVPTRVVSDLQTKSHRF